MVSLARIRAKRWATMAVTLLLVGCHSAPAPAPVYQTGIASWYGQPFNGRPTASGEIFDMEKMTAAHLTLPLGTVVVVHDLVNNRTVQVRINDRGPYVQGRIIDLSHGAAAALAMPGIATVSLTVISRPPTRAAENYAVEVGNFPDRVAAAQLQAQLATASSTTRVVYRAGDQTWRVLVGLQPTEESAESLAQQLQQQHGPAFVVLDDFDQ
jgi:rare lipoprotein A